MTVRIPKQSNDREIFRELHNIMEVFRSIFANDPEVCRNIDDNYEKILMADLRLVPEQYDQDILQYVKAVKLIVSNINYRAIHEGIKTIVPEYSRISFVIDSYAGAEQVLFKYSMSRTDRLRITNVMTKLRPIFACIDRVCSMPFQVIENIIAITDTTYGDILG